ncbi:ComEC/Rec2 family competence protein [Pedobacter frigoris]|uniref:ComEC/Rec2 family competence protein n=1 Tax=Pedobacter frigoris TaxID=2571272 RepID=UPI00145CB03F|nr:MBL fold metallo-hydrolase [Pedobacter frigoris]
MLKAFHGDSILINTYDAHGQAFNILIDGGTSKTFDTVLKRELKAVLKINLMILTHIDSDHIKGLIKFIKSNHFDASQVLHYWFNSKNIKFIISGENISYGQAKNFEELLIEKKVNPAKITEGITAENTKVLADGISAVILSPTQAILDRLYKDWEELKVQFFLPVNDVPMSKIVQSQIVRGKLNILALERFKPDKTVLSDIFNSSSIAMILNTFDLKLLLLADSRPEIVIAELQRLGYSANNKLKVDYVKISHHGSINNTSNDLLDLIDCDRFIISTNGGSGKHHFPDREVIARIIHHPERVKNDYPTKRFIYLNYPLDSVEKKSGQLVCNDDFIEGKWELISNVNLYSVADE